METSKSFKELGLIAPLLKQLEKLNYTSPSPIQAATIPLLLQKKDIIGLAQTGTGKTAAFALPLIQHIVSNPTQMKPNRVRSLILSPTRELAQQISDNIRSYGKELKLSSAVMFGGVGYGPQRKALSKGLDILIATPGRLLDFINQKAINLSQIETLVMDEADRMLDMGFLPDIKKIISHIPKERHTLLFSATMPNSISQLANSMLRSPETVMVAPPTSTADKVEQWLYHVENAAEKREKLLSLLDSSPVNGLTLLFARTKHGANKLATFLTKNGHSSSALHGGKGQGARQKLMKDFREGTIRTLVATDIAARGIDVKNVDLVVNYDLPVEPEVYIHRIGRTARADATGSSVSFCNLDEVKYAKAIQKLLGINIPLHHESNPPPASMLQGPREKRPNYSRNRTSQRPSSRRSRSGNSSRHRSEKYQHH